MRKCTGCLRRKPTEDFGKRKQCRDGIDTRCRECRRAEQRKKVERWDAARRRKEARKTNKARARRLHANYEERLEAQGGVCAICGGSPEPGRRLNSDHCHATGVERDLLCRSCNYGLGCFKDDPSRLRAAASYLERHGA